MVMRTKLPVVDDAVEAKREGYLQMHDRMSGCRRGRVSRLKTSRLMRLGGELGGERDSHAIS